MFMKGRSRSPRGEGTGKQGREASRPTKMTVRWSRSLSCPLLSETWGGRRNGRPPEDHERSAEGGACARRSRGRRPTATLLVVGLIQLPSVDIQVVRLEIVDIGAAHLLHVRHVLAAGAELVADQPSTALQRLH